MIPVPGSTFAGYQVLVECGKGAYGDVFLATDALGHRVAIKYMLSEDAGEYELKGLRNYMALPDRPNVLLQIYHCGLDDGCLFYVMEAADNASDDPEKYIPDTLENRLQRSGRLTAGQTLALGHALLDGLECLHQAGMLHRDIKPANIIFVNGIPKLADPGLTRTFAETISIAGTPGYLAPELLNGIKASPATDLYALGKVLYHAATGNPPELYPEQPTDVPIDELYQVCRPLLRICNSNPALRCQNCTEARQVLPQTIRTHGPLLRFRDRLVLQPTFRRQVVICAAQVLVVFILLLAMCFASRSRRAAEERFAVAMQCFNEQARATRRARLVQQLKLLEHDVPALDRQLAQLGETSAAPTLATIRRKLADDDLDSAASLLQAYRQTITELALRHLPAFDDALPPDFLRSGQGWGYLASPLGNLLPSPQRQALEDHLKREALAFGNPGDQRLGRTFNELQFKEFNMAFIPPGSFFSPTTQTTHTIEYPFWIQDTEIRSDFYTHLTLLPTPLNTPAQAAEYLTWNDALLFCRTLNDRLASFHKLPPGYAIRPPTEEEWEFVALDGWASTPPPPHEISSHEAAPKAGMGLSNSFGIYNLDDNLAEMATPFPEKPPQYAGAFVARGTDYRCDTTSVETRFDYLPDQGYRWGIGLRPVLAPTPPDFYETAWYRGPEIRVAAIDGAIYAGFTTIQADLCWEDAIQLAHDCGATLPESDDLPKLPEIYRRLGLVTDYPCHLAIQFQNDAWCDFETGKPCEDSRLLPATVPRNCLDASTVRPTPVTPNMEAPVVLMKWSSQEAFERRGETFLQNATIDSFELDGRHLAVCRAPLTPYAIRPFAKFLGLTQPTLDYSPEALPSFLSHFPDEQPCALGPIRFYQNWEQPDGSPIEFKETTPEYTLLTYHSRILCVLAVQNRNLVQASNISTFLVER